MRDDGTPGKAWGFNPCSGQCVETQNAAWWGVLGRRLQQPMCGRAVGTVVEVEVDGGRLLFSVDNGPPVDAGVELPPAVCAWALLYHPKDCVRLRQRSDEEREKEVQLSREQHELRAEQAQEEAVQQRLARHPCRSHP